MTEIAQIQEALKRHSHDVAVDGGAGPVTIAALKDFQAKNGLEADGICGDQTRAALGILFSCKSRDKMALNSRFFLFSRVFRPSFGAVFFIESTRTICYNFVSTDGSLSSLLYMYAPPVFRSGDTLTN